MTVDQLIDEIVEREGGFVNDPVDGGGPTKFGITKGTLARWRSRNVTVEDVKRLDVGEARDIYRAEYVVQPGFESVPEPLRSHLVDFGVNAGPAQAVRTLQRSLGVGVDGVFGPATRLALAEAIEEGGVDRLARRFWQERVRFYARLVALRPTQERFLDGWLNRCFAMQP
jgi:lysozyme family protein